MTTATPGTLWLMPNALDLGAEPVPLQDILPQGVIERASRLGHWVVEDARSARAFLKRVHALAPLAQPLQEISITELPRAPKGRPPRPAAHGGSPGAAQPPDPLQTLLAPALAGHDVGLLSEAGLPAVADPGAALVGAAHRLHIPVVPLPGPSALLLALAASGLDGQHFAFVGYLPQDATARAARIKELEALSRRLQQTQLCIETPYRNGALLQALVQHLDARTRLSVSCGLTLPGAFTHSTTVDGWRRTPRSLPDRVPAVFAFLAA